MKWLAVILSIYMVMLSCIPCADAAPAKDDARTSTSVYQDGAADHDMETDLCSPLCICHCCAGFALQISSQKVAPTIYIQTTSETAYRPLVALQPSFSIWQPPKL